MRFGFNMNSMNRVVLASILLLSSSAWTAAQDTADESNESADVGTEMILVVGAGGTPEYAEQFQQWAERWIEVAEKSNAAVTVIGRSNESETPDRDQFEKAIQTLSLDQGGPVWIVMIGHGTYARNIAKFNLRGRDVTATELAEWLKPIKRTVVVVDCASASGPFINRLSGDHRVIVTATKSGTEQNFARFGQYFADAIASPQSDLDHDDEVSVHEAFLRASAAVQQFYETEARISTEHALIDDNGDGRGTPAKMFRGTRVIAAAKDGASLDGKHASRITLSPARNPLILTSSELEERASIEQQLDALRDKKDSLSEKAYDAELEPLMIRLAKIYQAAEQRLEAGTGDPVDAENQ